MNELERLALEIVQDNDCPCETCVHRHDNPCVYSYECYPYFYCCLGVLEYLIHQAKSMKMEERSGDNADTDNN